MELAPKPPLPADGSYDKGVDMPVFLFVALAGAAGAGARYGLDLIFSRDAHHVPWVTRARVDVFAR